MSSESPESASEPSSPTGGTPAAVAVTAKAQPAAAAPRTSLAQAPAALNGVDDDTDLPAAPMSATRRMRSRLTRRMSGQPTPAAAGRTVLEPLFAVHRALH